MNTTTTTALDATTIRNYAVLQISKFRSRVIYTSHTVGATTPISMFEFASEPMPHGDALKQARYLATGIRTEAK
jgi:hypothetical protein